MKRLITATVITAALLAWAPLAQAQLGPENRYSPDQVSALIDRVHLDLNHAYVEWQFPGPDRDRLNKAEKQLREFAQKWRNAKFDKGELNDAIGSIQHVLDINRLPVESRDALSGDVERLRQIREAYDRHEIG
jgi:hypothetical protein